MHDGFDNVVCNLRSNHLFYWSTLCI